MKVCNYAPRIPASRNVCLTCGFRAFIPVCVIKLELWYQKCWGNVTHSVDAYQFSKSKDCWAITLIQPTLFCVIEIKSLRSDLTDISAVVKTLVLIPNVKLQVGKDSIEFDKKFLLLAVVELASDGTAIASHGTVVINLADFANISNGPRKLAFKVAAPTLIQKLLQRMQKDAPQVVMTISCVSVFVVVMFCACRHT